MINSSDRSFYIIRIYLIKKLYSPLSHERTKKKFMSFAYLVSNLLNEEKLTLEL